MKEKKLINTHMVGDCESHIWEGEKCKWHSDILPWVCLKVLLVVSLALLHYTSQVSVPKSGRVCYGCLKTLFQTINSFSAGQSQGLGYDFHSAHISGWQICPRTVCMRLLEGRITVGFLKLGQNCHQDSKFLDPPCKLRQLKHEMLPEQGFWKQWGS